MTSEAKIDIQVDDTQVEQLTRSLGALQQETRQVATGFDAVERQSTSAKTDVDRLDQSVKKLDRDMGGLSRASRTSASSLASIGRTAAGVALGVAGLDSAVAAVQKTIELAKTSVAAYAATNDQTAQSLGTLQTAISIAQVSLGELIVSALGGSDAFDDLADLVTETAGALAILAEAFATSETAGDGLAVSARELAVSLAETYLQIVNTFGALEDFGARIRFLSPAGAFRGYFLSSERLNEQLEETEERSRAAEEYLERVRNSTLDVDAAMERAARSTGRLNSALGARPAGGTAGVSAPATAASAAATRKQEAIETAEVYRGVFGEASRQLTGNIINLADHYMRIADALGGQEGRAFMEALFYNPNQQLIQGQRQMGGLGRVAAGMGNLPMQIEAADAQLASLQAEVNQLTARRDAERARQVTADRERVQAAEDRLAAEREAARALQEQAELSAQIAANARQAAGVNITGVTAGGIIGGALVGGTGIPVGGRGLSLATRGVGAVGRAAGPLSGAAGMFIAGAEGLSVSGAGLLGRGMQGLGMASRLAGGPAGVAAGALGGAAVGYSREIDRINEAQNRQFDAMVAANERTAAAARERALAQEAGLRVTEAELQLQRAQNAEADIQSDLDSRIALLGIQLLNTERERDRLRRAAGPDLERYNQAVEASNDLAQEGLETTRDQARELSLILAGQAGAGLAGPVVGIAQGVASRRGADIAALQASARTLRTGFGMRIDRDRATGIREFERGEFSTLTEAEDTLIQSLNRREQAFIDAETSVYDYISAVNKMKSQTRDAFRTEGLDAFVLTFETFGAAIGNAIGGGFDDGLSAGEKAKIVLFDLLGSVLTAIGSTAIAQGTITAVGDPTIGGFPNPARGAALIAAGTAAVAAGTAFSARAGNIGGTGSGGTAATGPGVATTPGRSGGGEAITNIIVENRFGSRFDAREMDRAAATSFERAAAAGQA